MRLFQVLWVGGVARLLAACVSPYDHVSTTTYDILQSALVPAPTPMHADAPLAPPRSVTVGGGATFAQALPGGQRRSGAGGHVVPVTSVRVRFAWRPNRYLEAALAGDGASAAWSSPHARDVRDGAFDGSNAFRLGPQVRVVLNPRSPVRFGLSSTFLGGRIPWARDISARSSSRTFDPQTGMTYTGSASADSSDGGGDTFLWISAAALLSGDIGRVASVLGGVSVQNQPAVTGFTTVSESCISPAGSVWPSCSGSTPSEVPVVRSTFASTVFLSGELHLGATLSLVGRFHAVVAGDPEVVAPGRFGGGVDLRGTFGY